MNIKEAYEELGLNYCKDKNLSLPKIEDIYRDLVKKFHPDKNNELPDYIKKWFFPKLIERGYLPLSINFGKNLIHLQNTPQ